MRYIIVLLCVSLSFGSIALAQPTSQPALRSLPTGKQIVVKKEELRAYTLEEFKTVLHIYTDYRSWGVQIPKLELQIQNLTQLTSNQARQLFLRAEEVKILHTERERLTKKWTEENRLRHIAENKPRFGSWIAWGSAAVMGVVAAVLVGILISK